MNLFAPLIPGMFCSIVGIGLVVLLRNMIPLRESPESSFESTSDYTVELLVPTDNPSVGLTVNEANLRNVRGGSLIEIVRFDQEIINSIHVNDYQFNDVIEGGRLNGGISDRTRGKRDAKVTVIIYVDFQCPGSMDKLTPA